MSMSVSLSLSLSDQFGETAMHFAARHNHLGVVDALLTAGACAHVATPDRGATPLHYAAQGGAREVAARLHAVGGSIHWMDDGRVTAGDVARQFGHHDIANAAIAAEGAAWEAAESARVVREAAAAAAAAAAEKAEREATIERHRERVRAKRRAFLAACDAERAAAAEADRERVERSIADARERVERVHAEEAGRKAEARARQARAEAAERAATEAHAATQLAARARKLNART